MARKSQTKRRYKLWNCNPHCTYCQVKLTCEESTLDHVIPLSDRQKERVGENTVLCCKECNSLKGCMSLEKWNLIVKLMSTEKWKKMKIDAKNKLARRIAASCGITILIPLSHRFD